MSTIKQRDRILELTEVPFPSSDAPEPTIIVAFQHCHAVHFRLPNDEAFASHPLHPRHDPEEFRQLRHSVWTFRDSVLECASLGYDVVEMPGPPSKAVPRMQALLGPPRTLP